MRVMTVVANPNPRSFTHALAEAASTELADRGATVAWHDLYQQGFHPVTPVSEARTSGLDVEAAIEACDDPVVQAHRRDLVDADVLVIAHPNWWGKPPAIMAGWLDRVLVPGVAYRLADRDGLPTPLLRLLGVVVLNTGDTPPDREVAEFGDPLDAMWRRCVGAYLGQAPIHRLLAGPMGGSTDDQRAAWLAEARAAATRFQQ